MKTYFGLALELSMLTFDLFLILQFYNELVECFNEDGTDGPVVLGFTMVLTLVIKGGSVDDQAKNFQLQYNPLNNYKHW